MTDCDCIVTVKFNERSQQSFCIPSLKVSFLQVVQVTILLVYNFFTLSLFILLDISKSKFAEGKDLDYSQILV